MNNLRSNTSGLDCEIADLQKDMYEALDAKYTFDIVGYPRVYKNEKEGGIIPEVWNETNQDYEDVFLDSSKPFTFLFIDGDSHSTDDEQVFIAPLKIVALVDLSKIDSVGRNDSEIHRAVVSIINNDTYTSFKIEEIEKGVDNVFRGFNTTRIKWSDMQPYHVFSVNGKLSYQLTKTCA